MGTQPSEVVRDITEPGWRDRENQQEVVFNELRQKIPTRKEHNMKKAGIVTDNYKVPVFKKALTDAGFTYTTAKFDKNNTIFSVMFKDEDAEKLKELVKFTNEAATK